MKGSEVHLGFEIGTGAPVAIPLRHMVVTGQTQEAGKTTALEALIARSGVKAVAFITKRGEGSFTGARVIPPYFREQADWKYVAAILEASRGEKLKFERAWIIRASKGARSLADVHRTVKRLLDDPKTKGINADVYLTLDFYLEDGCEGPRNGGSQDHQLPADHPFDPGGVVQWDKTLSGRLVVPVPFVAGGCPQCQGPPPWKLSGPCLQHSGRDRHLNPSLVGLPPGTARFHYPRDAKEPQACGIPVYPPYLMRGER